MSQSRSSVPSPDLSPLLLVICQYCARFITQTSKKLEWANSIKAIYKKGLSPGVTGLSTIIFYAVVSLGAGIKAKDTNRLNKLIKKARSEAGSKLGPPWGSGWGKNGDNNGSMSHTPFIQHWTSWRSPSATDSFGLTLSGSGTELIPAHHHQTLLVICHHQACEHWILKIHTLLITFTFLIVSYCMPAMTN